MKLKVLNTRQTLSVVLISDRHKHLVSKHKWRVNSAGYVYTRFKNSEGVWVSLVLHRFLMGLEKGDPLHCDHRNRNKLDNRDENLRVCTHGENMLNRKSQRGSQSKYKGVSLKGNKFQAVIRHKGQNKYLGLFGKEEDAALAYNNAAKELHGDFAFLNAV